MSYDVYLRSPECEHCKRKGEEPCCPDPTYNLTPIFDLALTGEACGLRALNGQKAKDTVRALKNAIERMSDPKLAERFKSLEPENGWGSLRGAIQVTEKLLGLAESYPTHVWEIQ